MLFNLIHTHLYLLVSDALPSIGVLSTTVTLVRDDVGVFLTEIVSKLYKL